MIADERRDQADANQHPQTIDNEPISDPDIRGSGMFQKDKAQPGDEPLRQTESPAGPAHARLGDSELARQHVGGALTIGDAIGAGPGLDVGSGTPADTGDLGGGDPQEVAEEVRRGRP